MRKIKMLCVCLLIGHALFAQSPSMFSYQAALRNSDGSVIANQNVVVLIEILSGTTDGPAVFTETHNTSTSPLGIVNLTVGSISDLGVVEWGVDTYFLKLSVDDVEVGVTQLLSVPFALHAKTAESVSGVIAETDPIFGSSPANDIVAGDITKWDAAYGWGDHAAAGYLSNYTETDQLWTASPSFGITNTNLTNWNAAYGWGDHAAAGYLTSYTETDPLWTASPSFGITNTNLTNWNAAYGWGDHSLSNYLKFRPEISSESYLMEVISPNLIFKGRIYDNLNQPLEGAIMITSNIYDSPTDGMMLWSEMQAVIIENGAFTIELGLINPLDEYLFELPTSLFIELQIEAETFDERVPLVRVSNAYESLVAQRLSGTNGMGSESGLDADMLDGHDSNYFLNENFEETDPTFNDWDKSTGIEITESQITDLKEYATKDMGSERITNLGDPTDAQDAATKAYVDELESRVTILENALLDAGIHPSKFKDERDENIYNYVTIGDQIWMAENLKYLPSVVGTGTKSYSIPYYYVYGYNGTVVDDAKLTENYSSYGVLYNWTAAMNGATTSTANPSGVQGICPTGWHLPSDAEWTELTDYLGGASIAGGKLKEAGTTHWLDPNTDATNESGFTALPGGTLHDNGQFYNLGTIGYHWTCTAWLEISSYCKRLYNNSAAVETQYPENVIGFSVRCVKD